MGYVFVFIFIFALICTFFPDSTDSTPSRPRPHEYNHTHTKPQSKFVINSTINTSIDYIDGLNGFEFEEYIGELLLKIGYTDVRITQKSGDKGIDILCYSGNESLGFQCKHYKGHVGAEAIQQALKGKSYYNLGDVCVITNSYFTSGAKRYAELHNVALYDRNSIVDSINYYFTS